MVDQGGKIVGRYRKIHLPGHADHKPQAPFQHLEKLYFQVGNEGFKVWETMGTKMGMCICNDPPLAGDLPRDGLAERRSGGARLQHPFA